MLNKRRVNIIRVLLRFDAGRVVGLGHLTRCRSLVKVILEEGPADITVVTDGPILGTFHGIKFRSVASSEIERLGRFDVAVVDRPGLSFREQKILAGMASSTLQINDHDKGPFAADVLIRPNLISMPRPRIVPKGGAYCAGGDFLILDPAFSRPSNDGMPVRQDVLVCFGGSDPSDFTRAFVQQLVPMLPQNLLERWRIHVILGSAYPHKQEIKSLVASRPGLRLSLGLPQLATAFASSAVAIISGGTLLYEACVSGVPALVLCQNAEQRREAMVLQKRGAAICLPESKPAVIEELRRQLLDLMADARGRRTMGRRARVACNPNGVYRVWSRIRKLVSKRSADEST